MTKQRHTVQETDTILEDTTPKARNYLYKMDLVQCKFLAEGVIQREKGNTSEITSPSSNQTGMPDRLKSGLENLSGYDLSGVQVHYNSPKPKQLGALAYAQGTNIHLGAGQERHLPHEAWHVVQQAQGRVKPTMQMKGGVGEVLQREFAAESSAQLPTPSDDKPNNTGLPDNLKVGVESLSGMSLDNVKVHYNSSQPAQLNARAYAQGTDIHLGPGQEQHLPHEAWHVVQQAQGRVKPTLQMKDGVPVNDDVGLEAEADLMGEKAISAGVEQAKEESGWSIKSNPIGSQKNVIQHFPAAGHPAVNGLHSDTFLQTNHKGQQVPSKIIVMAKETGNGGVPSVNPPGWMWLKTKFGKLKGQWVRFHIINADLGGLGNDIDNLVPTLHTVNHDANWRNLEEGAKANANAVKAWTYVEVDLEYDNKFPSGIPNGIKAEWGTYAHGIWTRSGPKVSLKQGNPKDVAGDNNYQFPNNITLGVLRDVYNVSNKDDRALAYQMIRAVYQDEEDFSRAWSNEVINNDTQWWDFQRFLIIDDDGGAGPFPMLVKIKK